MDEVYRRKLYAGREQCEGCGRRTFGGPILLDRVKATIGKVRAVLCFGCMEDRLGRRLMQDDLIFFPIYAGWIEYNSADPVARLLAHGRQLLPVYPSAAAELVKGHEEELEPIRPASAALPFSTWQSLRICGRDRTGWLGILKNALQNVA